MTVPQLLLSGVLMTISDVSPLPVEHTDEKDSRGKMIYGGAVLEVADKKHAAETTLDIWPMLVLTTSATADYLNRAVAS